MKNHTNLSHRLRSLAARPLMHFVLLGGLLFGLRQLVSDIPVASDGSGDTLLVTAPQVEQMRRDYQRNHGRLPAPAEEEGLLAELVDQELLVAEAFRLGLDRNDLVVRRRLTRKMHLLSDGEERGEKELYQEAIALGLGREDLIVRRRLTHKMHLLAAFGGGPVRPVEADVREYFERHRERFRKPGRILLTHVFLSRDRHGKDLAERAGRLLTELRQSGAAPAQAIDLGDPFLLGHHLPARTPEQLVRDFGTSFADQMADFEPGSWNGPVESAYGLHLVWVHQKTAPRIPELDSVRRQVVRDLAAEIRQQRITDLLDDLRARYTVRVEPPTPTLAREARETT